MKEGFQATLALMQETGARAAVTPHVNLEIGLMVEGQEGVSWPQWLDLARVAEQQGFAFLYRSDHYLSEHTGSNRDSLDAWGTICGLAAVTSRIRLGTLVSPVTFRHPSVLAKLAVTADHISVRSDRCRDRGRLVSGGARCLRL